MVRANVRPEDYVVMRVQRTTATSPTTGLINEAALLPRLTKADGTRLTPPRQYQLEAPGPNAWDPVGLTTMTGTKSAPAETHALGIGRRNAHPHAWNATVDGFVNTPFVCYIDGISVAEFAYQHFQQVGTEFVDNPTMQGGVLQPLTISDNGAGTAALDHPEYFVPAPKTHLVLNEGANGTAYYEGATRPIHYDGGGRILGEGSDHGEELDEISVYWDQLEYQKIELNVGNRSRVHRLSGWGYQRREWTGTEAPPHRFTFGVGISLIERPLGNKYNTLEVFDLEGGGGPIYDKSAVIAGFGTPNQSIDFVELGNTFYSYVVETGQMLATDPQAFATQRGAIAVSDSVTGFCVACIAKINNDPWPFDGCVTPNSLQVRFPCWDKFNGFTHPQLFSHTGPYFQVNTYDDTRRAPGWIGASYLLYVGHRSNLQAALDEILASGLIDQPVPQPPEAVWTGTEWPPQTAPGAITVDYFDDAIPPQAPDGGAVDICNMALANLGQTTQITSLDPLEDGDTTAALCARFYPKVRDTLLERRDWTFARKRAVLTSLEEALQDAEATSPTSAWDYCYVVPEDLLVLRGVHLEGATDDKTPQDAVVESVAGTKSILTDAAPGSWIRYTARITATSQFSPLFVEALSWFLAAKLAGPLTADLTKAEKCLKIAMATLAEASASDANQRQVDVRSTHKPPWISGRG